MRRILYSGAVRGASSAAIIAMKAFWMPVYFELRYGVASCKKIYLWRKEEELVVGELNSTKGQVGLSVEVMPQAPIALKDSEVRKYSGSFGLLS